MILRIYEKNCRTSVEIIMVILILDLYFCGYNKSFYGICYNHSYDIFGFQQIFFLNIMIKHLSVDPENIFKDPFLVKDSIFNNLGLLLISVPRRKNIWKQCGDKYLVNSQRWKASNYNRSLIVESGKIPSQAVLYHSSKITIPGRIIGQSTCEFLRENGFMLKFGHSFPFFIYQRYTLFKPILEQNN